MKQHHEHGRVSVGGDRPAPNPVRAVHPLSVGCEGSPPRPICVTSIVTHSPSLDIDVVRHARSPAINVLSDVPLPSDTPSYDIVLGLRRDRHAFHMRASLVHHTFSL